MSDNINNALDHIQDKINEYRKKTLEYYFEDESHVIFEKYTIDTRGIIKNKKSGLSLSYGNKTYNECSVRDATGKQRGIRVARAIASTFLGKPPTLAHTADHIESKQKKNDKLENIRWLCKPGQNKNQVRPETYKSAFVINKDGEEKTAKEWAVFMNDYKKPGERKFTDETIKEYARTKQHGFAYKIYDDFPREKWLEITWSKNLQGHWEISDMNRMKYVTLTGVVNVIKGDRLCLVNGYPAISINGKKWRCHVLAFMIFFPEEWAARNPGEMVLHEKDDKMDFCPYKLRLGTDSDNIKDSYYNGKRDDTKTERMKCASYINGVFERNHDSQKEAATYLIAKKVSKASISSIASNISKALIGDRMSAFKRSWKKL